ncbi:MAG: hypothetical protein COB02_07070 [Candidatus Cloacimonadota bacterium]|nr:MAG: hypothetical protein COB02_07070 [Candidatus Cloacimonadota bacterium]
MARGAGGTSGGLTHFFLGLVMSLSGAYLITNNVKVTSSYLTMRYQMYGGTSVSAFGITLIPLTLGIFYLFFDGESKIGWLLTLASIIAIFIGIVSNLQIYFATTSLYSFGIMLTLLFGGLGLVARSLRSFD